MSSLDEFLAEAERRRVDQAPAGALARLVEGLRLPSELIESHVRFDPAGYHRSLVRRTDALDLLILSWMPGQRSTVRRAELTPIMCGRSLKRYGSRRSAG